MKYTVQEFAQQIKKLYPDDYDDLTDEKLVELWLKKYPSDKDKIEFNKTPMYSTVLSEKSNDNNKIGSNKDKSGNVVPWLLFVIIIGIGIWVYNKSNNSSTNNINHNIESSGNTNSQPPNTNINTPLSNELNSSVNQSSINVDSILGVELSKEDDNTVVQILNDNNPDPDKKSGLSCGTASVSCKWCGKNFDVSALYYSDKEYINVLESAFLVMKPEEISARAHQVCLNYRSGDKYICAADPFHSPEFCSEKCKSEYDDYKKYH